MRYIYTVRWAANQSRDHPAASQSRDHPAVSQSRDHPISGQSRDDPISGQSRDYQVVSQGRDYPVASQGRDYPVAGQGADQTIDIGLEPTQATPERSPSRFWNLTDWNVTELAGWHCAVLWALLHGSAKH